MTLLADPHRRVGGYRVWGGAGRPHCPWISPRGAAGRAHPPDPTRPTATNLRCLLALRRKPVGISEECQKNARKVPAFCERTARRSFRVSRNLLVVCGR